MLSLRRKADFHTLFQHRRRAYGQWAVLHTRLRSPGEGPPLLRLAVSTTGKFPNAVQRNRARRLLRETCHPIVAGLSQPWDLLFIVRPGILATTFSDRRHAILDLLLQSGLPVEQAGPGSAGLPASGGRLACPRARREVLCLLPFCRAGMSPADSSCEVRLWRTHARRSPP